MKSVNNKKTARQLFAFAALRNRFFATALLFVLLGGVILARPLGVAAYGVPSMSYNIALRSVRTVANWLHLTPAKTALASTITLIPTVSGCYYTGGQSKATISVEVAWTMVSDGDTINVTQGATTRSIAVNSTANPPIVSPQVVAFEVTADASSYTITAALLSNGAINDTANVTAPAACAPLVCGVNDLGGTVFNDYNADGIKQAGETNGMPGVTVTAYDIDGTPYTTTSSSTGRYCLTIPTGKYPVRVEFTNLPAESSGGFATPVGTDNQSTVQFVAAPDTTVDLGVNNPADYCQVNPKVLTPTYVSGDPLATTGTPANDAANVPALLRFDYANDGLMTGLGSFANANEVGALWALAYKRQTNHLFSAATVRRHAGLGPQGLGGIYILNPQGVGTTGNVVDSWNVTTELGVDVQNPGSPFGGSATPATSNFNRGLSADKTAPSQDAAGFSSVGKLGIGDIDLAEDGSTLFFVNHYDKKLYVVDISGYDPTNTATRPTASDVNSYVIPDPGCSGGAWRPSGLKVRRTTVYVGGVCDAESSQSLGDLRAIVQAFDTGTTNWNQIFNFPLSYPKGSPNGGVEKGWHPWSDNWATILNGDTNIIYSVPMFTDIEFDLDGSMVLGFNDRSGMQTGRNNYRPTDGTGNFSGFTGGDTLRAFYSNGTYILENAAKAGPFTGFSTNNNEGPGFGEFYEDNWRTDGHTETTVGGLAIRPGSGEIVVGSMDPHESSIWAAGVRYLSNSTGVRTHAYAIYNNGTSIGSTEIGKSTGVGDIELLCDSLSYLEIGNRVWVDADQDGIQDPGEANVPGVTVRLYQNNTLVGTAVTNATGNFYFRSSASADGNTTDEIGLVNGGIQTTTAYEVRVAKNQSSLYGLLMTTANTDMTTNGDARDSDATSGATDFVIALTTGSIGQDDHTFDIGFFYNDYSLGNRVWYDLDNSGTINGAETGADGVVVRLLKSDLSPALDNTGAAVADQTTANGGYYRFDHLPVGDYIVELTAANFTGVGVLNGLLVSTGAGQEANPNLNVDSNDNGLDTPVGGAIRSGTVSLGPNCSEPTNETNLGTGDPTEPACHTNLTVDFGFVVPLNLGNLIWKDYDNDGSKDVGEPGIDGVIVDLYLDRDSSGGFSPGDFPALANTTTAGGGFYNFSDLQPGNYTVNIINTNFQSGGMLYGCLSSTTTVANPETTVDSDDNGIDDATPGVNGIHSGRITLSAFGEPLTAVDTDGNNGNLTLDFGFYSTFSLGNRVWKDLDNSGTINAADGGSPGINGVTVRLRTSASGAVTDAYGQPVNDQTTANGGYYRFVNLVPGDYYVEIVSGNFSGAGMLVGCISSRSTEADPNADADNNDNGLDTPVSGAIRSATITLGPAANAEPNNETDLGTGDPAEPNASTNMTVDFGFAPAYALGNRVWKDLDNSGTINAADGLTPGVNGVTVRLLKANGTPATDFNNQAVADQTTANGGYYRFDNLLAGDYLVEIISTNFNSSGALFACESSRTTETNPNTDADSNDNGLDARVAGAIRSGTITLGPAPGSEPSNETDLSISDPIEPNATNNLTIDFGFVPTFALGNRVWKDLDNSGTINVADGLTPGVDGVTVRLLNAGGNQATDLNGALVANQTTANGGYYRFDNLLAGDYFVEITAANFTGAGMLVGCVSSRPTETSPNDNADSNDNGLDAPVSGATRSGMITLGPLPNSEPTNETDRASSDPVEPNGNTNLTVDFGFIPVFTLGNRVWKDLDNSGTINAADGLTPGVNNVVVRLLNTNGTQATDINGANVVNQTTANGGYYRFSNLLAGDYIIEIAASNFTGAGSLVACVSSRTTESDPNSNADNNDNGIDTPVSGAIRSGTITLGPAPNTEPNNETDLGTGDPTEPNAMTNLSIDFGFAPTYALGNRVWKDLDNSGTINLADGVSPGVNGVTVRLLKSDGSAATDMNNQAVADQTTANGGYYRFDNLLAGDYLVEIVSGNFGSGAPLFYCESSRTTETDPNTNADSNDNGLDTRVAGAIRSGTITLGPAPNSEPTNESDLWTTDPVEPNATTNQSIDFGFVPTFALGNRVWKDLDNSGTINGADGGTPGVNGVTVRLLKTDGSQATDLNGAPVANQTTANGGYYRFDNLLAGDYLVEIASSNFNGGGSLFSCESSRPTESNPNDNADSNDNGLDARVAGAIRSGTITLGPAPNSEPSTETDRASSDPVEPNANTNLTVDFGFIPVYALGNRVWKDLDNSGTINAADGLTPGIDGIVVRLLTSAGNQATDLNGVAVADQTTANGGYYRFENLLTGDYLVEIAASNLTGAGTLAGCVSSRTTEASPNTDADNNDNGIDTPVSGAIRSGTITLGPAPNSEPSTETDLGAGDPAEPNASTNLSVDFGFVPTYALGNRVWKDLDNSGTINAADGLNPGVNGVTVRLLRANGSAATDMNNQPVADQTTANGGYYRFDNLLSGDYLIEIVSGNFGTGAPLFYCESSRTTETDPNTNADINDNGLDARVAGAIRSGAITLGPLPNSEPTNESDLGAGDPTEPNATTNQSIDFGFVPTFVLGNRVWKDLDNSGTINAADGVSPGIDGVVVRLLKTDGSAATDLNGSTVANQTTAAGGYYRFENLLAGDYLVEVASSNFGTSAVLFSCESSRGAQEAAPNTNGDSNDNGLDARVAGAIRSGTITLGPAPNSEPSNETDRAATDPAEPNANTNLTVDFGFIPVYALGNRVWKDIDNSGTINGTEAGVNGVVVKLLTAAGNQATDLNGVAVADQTTANGGYYRFENLIAGDFVVEIVSSNFANAGVLLNCESSRGTQEADPNTNGDSNDNGLDTAVSGAIRSGTITLGPLPNSEPSTETDRSPSDPAEPNANTNLTVDFGFVPVYTLGNRVWKDLDNSGTINAADGGSPGVDGVTVRLLKTDGNAAIDLNGVAVTNQTTANGGYYRFTNLIPGEYLVEIASANFGTNAALFYCESSRTTESNPNADVDLNDNGLDTRVAGAIRSGTITLGPNPNSEPTNETDRASSDPAEPNASTNLSVDFGFVPTYALGNRVWKDLDNSGTINAADGVTPGVDGVVVRLLKSDGTSVTDINGAAVANQTTANGGYYRFDNLLAGDYLVEIASSNFGSGAALFYCESSRTTEADPNTNADLNDNGLDTRVGNAIRSAAITLGPNPNSEPNNETDRAPSDPAEPNGNTNLTLDFGFVPTFALGNRVWKDLDYSGTINAADGGTPGLNGIVVRLLKSDGSSVTDVNGQTVANQTTANGGYYRFENLLAGDYVVEVVSSNFASNGVLFGCASSRGAQEASPNSNADSNDNGLDAPVSGAIRSGTVTLGPNPNSEPTNETDRAASDPVEPNGNTNLTVDFGFITTYVLGNRVWKDADNSGARNGSEVGVNNVVLRLVNATTNVTATDINGATVANQTTANGGYYRFENLPGGDYFVEVIASNFTTGNALFGCVTSTGAPGFVSTGTGPNEPAPDGDTNATDNDDNGSLNGSVVRSLPVTLGPTGANEPANEADLGPGDSGSVPDAVSNLTVDFGFTNPMNVGNLVWKDYDNDGLRDTANPNEPVVGNVKLVLYSDSNNNSTFELATDTMLTMQNTANDGSYSFANLLPGNYFVVTDASNFNGTGTLVGCFSSTGNTAGNSDVDNSDHGVDNATPATLGIASSVITLVGGAEPTNDGNDANGNQTIDFGYVPNNLTIGNLIWKDLNFDGIKNGAEVGIANVKLNLYRDTNRNRVFDSATDVLVGMQTTNSSGNYLFANLIPDLYFVQVDASNFAPNGSLHGCASSNRTVDGNSDLNEQDHGSTSTNPFLNPPVSSVIDLVAYNEPNGPDGDGDNGNLTIDFGFVTVAISVINDMGMCVSPGATLTLTTNVSNPGLTTQGNNPGPEFTATFPAGIFGVPGTGTSSGGGTITVTSTGVTWDGTIPPAGTVTLSYRVQVANNAQAGTNLCVTSTVYADSDNNGTNEGSMSTQTCHVVNCPAVAPGEIPSNGSASSVLIFPLYSSSASNPADQNTRINITNYHPVKAVNLHLFYVDGASCSVADAALCLTAQQTSSFLMSDIDPGTTGYLMAVAVDGSGCPINFNYLGGDAFVKFESGHRGNLDAHGIPAIAGGTLACDANSNSTTLNFDGLNYGLLPRTVAVSNIASPEDDNSMMLFLNRIGGDYMVGADKLGSVFGLLYDDAEKSYSFSFTPNTCQFRSELSSSFPRSTPRLPGVIPAGRAGWMKLFSQGDAGIVGGTLNHNPNSATQTNAFNGGRNLHVMTFSNAARVTIPVFPPHC